jgi:hypothetical protein
VFAKPLLRMASSALVAAHFALFAAVANAQDRPDIDGIDFDAGGTEIELETRFFDTGDGTGLMMQLQAEHALDDRWALGAELELERDPGETLEADTAIASLKWRAPRSDGGIAFALQAGAGYAFSDDAAAIEAAAYIGWSTGDWSLAGKFDMLQLLQDQAEPEFGYRLRLARELESDIEIGIEAGGDLWAGAEPQHRIGPFVEVPLGGDDAPVLELGAFAGLTRDTPDMQYRVEIEFEF